MALLFRRPRRRASLAVAAALALAVPVTGDAGTATALGRTLAYVAAPGEANRVTVTRSPDAYGILDRGAAVVAAAGCTAVARNEARCAGDEVRVIRIQVLDANDVVSLSTGRRSIVGGGEGDDVLEGGEGDDQLYGDAGDDTLKGGDGFDVLTGAAGADTLSGGGPPLLTPPLEEESEDSEGGFVVDFAVYSGRTNGVGVDLDGAADDGEAGEGDNVLPDVEVVETGSGNDTLIGNRGINAFFAGPGRDRVVAGGGEDFLFGGSGGDVLAAGGGRFNAIVAGAGNDTVTGGGGSDELEGGRGNDFLDGRGRGDALHAGPGNDRLLGRAGADFLAGGTGRDVMVAGRGFDELLARDGFRDRVTGGPGRDRARVDKGLDAVTGIEGEYRPFEELIDEGLLPASPEDDRLTGAVRAVLAARAAR